MALELAETNGERVAEVFQKMRRASKRSPSTRRVRFLSPPSRHCRPALGQSCSSDAPEVARLGSASEDGAEPLPRRIGIARSAGVVVVLDGPLGIHPFDVRAEVAPVERGRLPELAAVAPDAHQSDCADLPPSTVVDRERRAPCCVHRTSLTRSVRPTLDLEHTFECGDAPELAGGGRS